ncbi:MULTISPECIES: hypothetical protein [Nostoc]|uniref:Uncharacterized protein n=2 Tax=Nostoc TaxID=1177 RepID=A0ABR8IIC2_9NOSO|nr:MULTISPECIES: hypothetical protein [Nostoc]MBD2565841.1 hypothetical protein [Nostoc linckia FACHB-391]MBD2650938.1 hypothetical protein [Nostoc foliaceum FACHB-393]
MTKPSLKTGCKNFIQSFQNQSVVYRRRHSTLALPSISNHVQAYAIALALLKERKTFGIIDNGFSVEYQSKLEEKP